VTGAPLQRARLSLRVQPRSRSDTLVDLREGVVIVRVTAPPVDGRANAAVARVLARVLGVRASELTILRGERGRDKVIEVEGLGQREAEAAVRAALARAPLKGAR
jgi:uncharacterized protein (TIGR00251 family)